MEKVKFSDLKLDNKDFKEDIKYVNVNGKEVIIKNSVDIDTKLKFAEYVVNSMISENDKFFNIIKFNYYKILGFIKFYTNIDISDYTDEELKNVYNIFIYSSSIFKITPSVNFTEDANKVKEILEQYFNYKNSIYGILDTISTNYEDLNLDMSKLKEEMIDENSLTLLKDVVTKLG